MIMYKIQENLKFQGDLKLASSPDAKITAVGTWWIAEIGLFRLARFGRRQDEQLCPSDAMVAGYVVLETNKRVVDACDKNCLICNPA
jgi:hypothetical protein